MKHTIIFALLISALLLSACNSALSPKTLAAKTQDTVAEIKTTNVTVFDEIQGNLDMVAGLKTKMHQAQIDGKPIPLKSVIRDIEKVADSYDKLASQKDDIKKQLLQQISRAERMRTTVDVEIQALKDKRADYTEQLRLVKDSDPEIARTRRIALTKAISYVDAQTQLWREFSSIQGDIVIEMGDIQQRIDSFLAMIESSAIVFREGLNLLYLQQNINEAIALFTGDLPRMEQLTQDMEKSWSNLDYLLETLTGIATIKINQ